MVLKTSETLYNFVNLAGLLLVALVVVALYPPYNVNFLNMFRKQATMYKNPNSSASCDFFSGKWIYDNVSYPLYKERECSFIEPGLCCERFGRKDLKYQNWRWQPHHCDLPRFNARAMLEKIRGKKILFVGDSLCRNQWSSFLCLIEPSLSPSSNKTIIYRSGNSFRYYHDIEYNTTIAFHWSPFLVETDCDDPKHPNVVNSIIRVTSIEKNGKEWRDADILIFDSYAWWFNNQTLLWGQKGTSDSIYKKVKTQRGYEMALSTWSDWLEININRTKTKLFFMSASPYVRKGYDTGSGRCCNITEPTGTGDEAGFLINVNYTIVRAVERAIRELESRSVKVEYLLISRLSEYRRDAHPSIYRPFYTVSRAEGLRDPYMHADCIHWCLPGVPDIWNQILYHYIMKS